MGDIESGQPLKLSGRKNVFDLTTEQHSRPAKEIGLILEAERKLAFVTL